MFSQLFPIVINCAVISFEPTSRICCMPVKANGLNCWVLAVKLWRQDHFTTFAIVLLPTALATLLAKDVCTS